MHKLKAPTRKTFVRIPKPLDDRLRLIAAKRSIREGRSVSVNALIVEAIEQSLAALSGAA